MAQDPGVLLVPDVVSGIPASRPPRRPVLSSWGDFAAMLRVALVPLLGWLVMAYAVGLTFGHAVSANLGVEFAGQALGSFDARPWASAVAMFSSLVAGLGFQVGGTTGVPTSLALAVAPLGTLAVLAVLTRLATRRCFRRRPPASFPDLFIRISLIAALASVLIYAFSALAILVFANNGVPPAEPPTGLLGGALPANPTGASPLPDRLLLVLFPTLWIGALMGVLSLAPARAFLRAPLERAFGGLGVALAGWLSPVLVAVRSYIVLVLLLTVPLVAGMVGWLLWASPLSPVGDPPDTGAILLSIPTLLAVGPNALLALALAATGQPVDFGSDGSAVMRGSLWQMDGWAITAGLLCLLVPPLLVGMRLRRRGRDAGPGQVIAAGLGVGVVALLGALVALPAVRQVVPISAAGLDGTGLGVTGSIGSASVETSVLLVSDLTQAMVVGGIAIVLAVMLGFGLGGLFRKPRLPRRHRAASGTAAATEASPAAGGEVAAGAPAPEAVPTKRTRKPSAPSPAKAPPAQAAPPAPAKRTRKPKEG